MKTAILIPSLNRPQRLHDLVMNLRETTAAERMFCVSDEESKQILTELGEWFLDDSDVEDRRYVTRMNKLVAVLPYDVEAVFFGSDDVVYRENWLPNAQRVLKGFACVVVNDLRNQNGTQALMRRDYLEQCAVFDAPGLAFHPGYLHNFADTEQFATAHKNGEFARAMDSVVEHFHPLFGGENAAPWDATYRNAMFGWDHDAALFNQRMALLGVR